jgi:hypothetical protein
MGLVLNTNPTFYIQLHFPEQLVICGRQEGQNSDVGKAIELNKEQGSSSRGETHSLSGTQYSVAFTKS